MVLPQGGHVSLFGRTIPVPYFRASWPLAKLQVNEDFITVASRPFFSITIPWSDVEEIRLENPTILNFGARSLVIKHHSNGPNPIKFICWGGLPSKIVTTLRDSGVLVLDPEDPKENAHAKNNRTQ